MAKPSESPSTDPVCPVSQDLRLEQFLPYRLSVLSNTISSSIAETYAEQFRLSIPEWRIIAVLGRFPGVSAREVASRTAMDKVAVSRAVARLLTAGHITRQIADNDRRRSILKLSNGGRRIYDKISPMALDYEHRLLQTLSADDQAMLDQLLTMLTERAKHLHHRN